MDSSNLFECYFEILYDYSKSLFILIGRSATAAESKSGSLLETISNETPSIG